MLTDREDHLTVNRAKGDERAPAHAASIDYGLDRFIGDSNHVSGVDFSSAALTQARGLAMSAGTGIDALCWLPDVARGASVVADLLRPGSRLFIREGHPILWALDEKTPHGGCRAQAAKSVRRRTVPSRLIRVRP